MGTDRIGTLTTRALAIGVLALGMLGATGCITRFLSDEPGVSERLRTAPPIALETLNGRHLIVLRAPNPGWSIKLDATERTREGKRVYLTFRAPDPALYYPQRIVHKRVLTQVREGTALELAARVLDHDAKARKQSYAALEPLDSFE